MLVTHLDLYCYRSSLLTVLIGLAIERNILPTLFGWIFNLITTFFNVITDLLSFLN